MSWNQSFGSDDRKAAALSANERRLFEILQISGGDGAADHDAAALNACRRQVFDDFANPYAKSQVRVRARFG